MRISTGKNRKDLRWKVTDISWDELCARLETPHRGYETIREYGSLTADKRAELKDIGGFVGGVIKDGRRLARNVESRSLITLDADYAPVGMWEEVTVVHDYTMCCYSTRSHKPNSPRLRFVIPLDREVTPEEYEPIARMIAKDMGIEAFDVTTYEACRLMYWPSVCNDGEYLFERQDGSLLSADEILARYKDWHDVLSWPISDKENEVHRKKAAAQADPTSKKGVVGAFCRTYDIHSAIAEFLPEIYEPTDEPNRYTYTLGSTSSGVVVYNNGNFCYSHHSTDPAGQQLCNAFDMVRLHKFFDLDYEVSPDTPIGHLPSFKAMSEFANEDNQVKQVIMLERFERAAEEFKDETPEIDDADEPNAEEVEEDDSWLSKLTMSKGEVGNTVANIEAILTHDPNLKNRIKYNEFSYRRNVSGKVPWNQKVKEGTMRNWTDADEDGCVKYIESIYKIYSPDKTRKALSGIDNRMAYHPVQDYLKGLEWDGIERVETFFMDYMGAERTHYARMATRKWLISAVARAMHPGCKVDTLLVLVGAQGIGKSRLARQLSKGWFSDSFSSFVGKDAMDQVRGYWIIELAELSAMRKTENEQIKLFLSKQVDDYRVAYGRNNDSFPRQCVFYGSTNDEQFLKDRTGNRRFWPLAVSGEGMDKLTDETVDQVWAEAVEYYRQGEILYFDKETEDMAKAEQHRYMEENPRVGLIEVYLERTFPEGWDTFSADERRAYLGYSDGYNGLVNHTLQTISAQEIAVEVLGIHSGSITTGQIKEIHSLMRELSSTWERTGLREMTPYGRQYIYKRVKK